MQYQKTLTSHPAGHIWVRRSLLGLAVLFLAVAQIRLIHAAFPTGIQAHIAASEGVVDGLPHWRLFQSRVLGPYLVRAATVAGLPLERAYALMMFVWLALFFAVVIAAGIDLWGSSLAAVAAAGSAALLNAVLMQDEWLYPWDFIDLIVFAALTWAVLGRKPLAVIAGLIAIEIFNRESATIIAGWLALDGLLGLVWKNASTAERASARRRLATGVLLGAVSVATIEMLRATLLIREIGYEIFPEAAGPGAFLGFKLGFNVYELKRWLLTQPNLMLPYGILVAAIPVIGVLGLASRDPGARRISLLFLVLWLFTILFGVVYETRVWLAFVPFVVLATPVIVGARRRGPT